MLKDYYYVLDEGHLPELLKRVDVTFLNTSHCLKSYPETDVNRSMQTVMRSQVTTVAVSEWVNVI